MTTSNEKLEAYNEGKHEERKRIEDLVIFMHNQWLKSDLPEAAMVADILRESIVYGDTADKCKQRIEGKLGAYIRVRAQREAESHQRANRPGNWKSSH